MRYSQQQVERAFSAMKLIKTDIRNKMGDKFLSDSLVSYIEKDVLDGFDNDAIIARFQAIRPRRIQFGLRILSKHFSPVLTRTQSQSRRRRVQNKKLGETGAPPPPPFF
ncbi:hypothetical protein LXL04_007590 [Taraxacum kok-saghyz]